LRWRRTKNRPEGGRGAEFWNADNLLRSCYSVSDSRAVVDIDWGNSGHSVTLIEAGPLSGFIVIYRWQVQSSHQEEFRASWREVTMEGRALGSLGSCLTRDSNGDFLAIALWPSEQARADAFSQMKPRSDGAGAQRIDEIKLEIDNDLWTRSPFAGQAL